MITKLGPHVIIPTEAALSWARQAPIVKALDDPTPLRAAERAKVLVFRAYFPDQNISPEEAFNIVNSRLAGFRDPRLYVEGLNEIHQYLEWGFADYVAWTRRFVELCHQAGLKVAGFSFSTGTPRLPTDPGGAAEWDYLRSQGWAGVDAIAIHEYWGNQGFSGYNALRYRAVHAYLQNHPPFIVTECGRDAVEGGQGGWHRDGISAEQYLQELEAYDAELAKDDYVLGATVFTAGPTPDWQAFEVDSLATSLAATSFAPSPAQTGGAETAAAPPTPPSPFEAWVSEGGDGTLTGYLQHVRALGGPPTVEVALRDGWRPSPEWLLAVDAGRPAMDGPWPAEGLAALKALGVELVIIGAFHQLQGKAIYNEFAPETLRRALKAGLRIGTYVAPGPRVAPALVISVVKNLLRDVWPYLELVAMDAEVSGLTVERIGQWLDAIKDAGGRPWLYTGKWFWRQLGAPTRPWDVPLWLAEYDIEPGSVEPLTGWDVVSGHQFEGTTSLAGLSVDVNVFRREALSMGIPESLKQELKTQLDAAWGEAEGLKTIDTVPVGQVASFAQAKAAAIQSALAVIATRLRELELLPTEV